MSTNPRNSLADISPAPNMLEKRAASCTKASQCKSVKYPAHGQPTCVSRRCSWKCNTNYTKVGSTCVKTSQLKEAKAKVAVKKTTTKKKTTTTQRQAQTKATARAASTSKGTVLAAAGVTSFTGTNSGIGSWYNANSAQDSTNGRSWCEFPYTNDSPVFAPSVGTMRKNFGYNNAAAASAYCGLEAIVTTSDGRSKTMYIGDGFDDAWVRTPGSIDIMHSAWNSIAGKSTNNKNDVLQVTWKLTGNRNDKYKYRGQGDS